MLGIVVVTVLMTALWCSLEMQDVLDLFQGKGSIRIAGHDRCGSFSLSSSLSFPSLFLSKVFLLIDVLID